MWQTCKALRFSWGFVLLRNTIRLHDHAGVEQLQQWKISDSFQVLEIRNC